ncbi:unnamed protein product [Prorocentrum cordatum]|uniref:UBA domain-containing protein n=1 Tax=Prorocentrum cordatum TaxID=2364126 RepID=A0ABN9TMU1_9DINO|nr:unnamed protein product [Polarella glacialis]
MRLGEWLAGGDELPPPGACQEEAAGSLAPLRAEAAAAAAAPAVPGGWLVGDLAEVDGPPVEYKPYLVCLVEGGEAVVRGEAGPFVRVPLAALQAFRSSNSAAPVLISWHFRELKHFIELSDKEALRNCADMQRLVDSSSRAYMAFHSAYQGGGGIPETGGGVAFLMPYDRAELALPADQHPLREFTSIVPKRIAELRVLDAERFREHYKFNFERFTAMIDFSDFDPIGKWRATKRIVMLAARKRTAAWAERWIPPIFMCAGYHNYNDWMEWCVPYVTAVLRRPQFSANFRVDDYTGNLGARRDMAVGICEFAWQRSVLAAGRLVHRGHLARSPPSLLRPTLEELAGAWAASHRVHVRLIKLSCPHGCSQKESAHNVDDISHCMKSEDVVTPVLAEGPAGSILTRVAFNGKKAGDYHIDHAIARPAVALKTYNYMRAQCEIIGLPNTIYHCTGIHPYDEDHPNSAIDFRVPLLQTDSYKNAAAVAASSPCPEVVRTYRWSQFWGKDRECVDQWWSQFWGKEEVTEFDEAHFKCEGKFQQNSSQGHKEYQDRLRAIHLRAQGIPKADIARSLGRSEKFVAKWWQKEQQEVPRPWGVHEYLTKDMGAKQSGVGATSSAQLLDQSASDTATWWRDVEATNARTRDFATGAFHLKYDQRGNIKWEGHQAGRYKQGMSAGMDKCLQKLFAEYGIADRTSGVLTNWYPDGKGYLVPVCGALSHRHDCWTALFSFGCERILTIDNTPLLMQDGDLVIFGTQRHGVPVMPEIEEGRITFVIFFYPDSMQKQGMWQTITDPDTMAPSRPLQRMIAEGDLGAAAEQQVVVASGKVQALQELGFSSADAEAALRVSGLDVERAAAALLLSSAAAGDAWLGPATDAAGEANRADPDCLDSEARGLPPAREEQLPTRLGRFRNRHPVAQPGGVPAGTSCSSSASCSAPSGESSTAAPSSAASSHECGSSVGCSDEALAVRLQSEGPGGGPAAGEMSDAEVVALALQLDEMEAARAADPALLAAQFGEYDAALTQEDAERWNGHGDLMHSPFSREHLELDRMEPATLYSVGHGDMPERDFWEMLQCHSVRVLYDTRQTDSRGELYSRHQRFSVASLRAQCRARGIFFKSMPIGRESAYVELPCAREGRHTLVELAWQGRRKRTAFLGREELWRDDARQVTAEELARAGHRVEHVRSDGSTERHEPGVQYPDWLVREADRLRLLEKKRQAGELARPQKSRTDRSAEVIASQLARPAEEVDAMREMQGAANQKELVVAQRRLARFQRVAEEKGALAAKVVKNVPQWIQEDARKQAEWVAAKKLEKKAQDGCPPGAEAALGSQPSAARAEAEDVDVAQLERVAGAALHRALLEAAELEEATLEETAGLGPAAGDEAAAGGEGAAAAEGPLEGIEEGTRAEARGPEAAEAAPGRGTWRGRRRAGQGG